MLEGRDVFGPAIGIAAVVEGIDADEDVLRGERLRPGERERKKNGVPRRYIRGRNVLTHLPWRAILRHVDSGGKRRSAEAPEIEVDDFVTRDVKGARDASRRFDLEGMPLPIPKRHRVRREAFALRNRQRRRRIDAAAEQHDGFPFTVMHDRKLSSAGTAAAADRSAAQAHESRRGARVPQGRSLPSARRAGGDVDGDGVHRDLSQDAEGAGQSERAWWDRAVRGGSQAPGVSARRARSQSPGTPRRFAVCSKAAAGPRQRNSSKSSNTGASVRSVASLRKSSASSRFSSRAAASRAAPRTATPHSVALFGIDSRCGYLPSTTDDAFSPQPGTPGNPSAVSPTNAR